MDSIINKLMDYDKKFPRKELEKAIENKDAIIPLLLDSLDKINENIEIVTKNPDYMLHLYSIYLLAQFREERAFEKIVRLISHSSEEVDEVLGDTITEGLPSILYSVYNGDLLLLQHVIENQSINEYVRSAALEVYAQLYSDDLVSRESLLNYLRELVKKSIQEDDLPLATPIQGVVIDYHLFEMIEDVQLLYDEQCIDELVYGKYDDFIDCIFNYDYDRRVKYIDNTIEAMQWWAMFEQSDEDVIKREAQLNKQIKKLEAESKNFDANRKNLAEAKERIGRNDPCICGSGKKYKRCCIDKVINNEDEKAIPTEDRAEWLTDYPTEELKHEDQVLITHMFDEESIRIDELVYLALHRRSIPMWIKSDEIVENHNRIIYLAEACDLFLLKCEKDDIHSFVEYDKKHKIHYRSEDWFQRFKSLLEENEAHDLYEPTIEKVKETIEKMRDGS